MRQTFSRREAIIRFGYLTGGALSASTLAALMASCASERKAGTGRGPRIVPQASAGVLEGLIDGILPATETPGAVEAGVPEFFDLMLRDYFTAIARDVVVAGLQGVDATCVEVYGLPWERLGSGQKTAMVQRLDRQAVAQRKESGTPHFFAIVKEMTLWGYFYSEAGAAQLQRYEISPGAYEGCIDYDDVGKPWTFIVSPPNLDDYFV